MTHKTPLLTTLLLGTTLFTQSVGAAEYIILIRETARDLALRTDTGAAGKAYWAEYAQFGAQLANAGAMRDGAALQPANTKGTPQALHLSGYFKIEAAHLAAAQALAQMAPTVRRGGAVEVMATLPNPNMSAK